MEFVPKNVHWLLPEEPSPCDVLLHFRGQFATAISAGQQDVGGLVETHRHGETEVAQAVRQHWPLGGTAARAVGEEQDLGPGFSRPGHGGVGIAGR